MESKVQLLEIVSKKASDRKDYIIDLLKNMPEEVAKEVIYIEIPKNEYLVCEGEKCDAIYILLKGRVVGLDHQSVGRVHSFMDFTKMYIIGDFELFGDIKDYKVTVQTAEDCKLLKLSANMYLHWIKNDANALFLRLRLIVNTLSNERKNDRKFLVMACKDRLAVFLVKYYEREATNKKARIKVKKTQSELADKVGYNIRSVQRCIASLEKEGLIANETGKIVIGQEHYLALKEYLEDK